MKKGFFKNFSMAITAIAVLGITQTALAQEVFVLGTEQNGGIDRNYPWSNNYTSERFVIRYSEDRAHDAYVTEANARTALNTLERAYDSLVNNFGFYPPYHERATTKYKSEIIVTRGRNNTSGTTAWADGGGTAYGGLIGSFSSGGANSTERPIQWIPSRLDSTTLTHEFVHGFSRCPAECGQMFRITIILSAGSTNPTPSS
ncbi:MAG: hypothetical protein LBU89_09480 [Fibromonadaceae bacterium]|nr:hypothetical protein [Fibromonadaceae bacterium]